MGHRGTRGFKVLLGHRESWGSLVPLALQESKALKGLQGPRGFRG